MHHPEKGKSSIQATHWRSSWRAAELKQLRVSLVRMISLFLKYQDKTSLTVDSQFGCPERHFPDEPYSL